MWNLNYFTFTGNLYSQDNFNLRIPFLLDTVLKKENVVAVESPGMCHTGVHRCVCAAHGPQPTSCLKLNHKSYEI